MELCTRRLRATSYALTALALLAFTFASSRPASAAADKDKEKKPNRQVVRFVAYKEKVPYQGGKSVMVLGVEPLEGGRTMELVVKNKDMNKKEYDPVINTDHVNALQKGDAIKIGLDDSRPRPLVDYLKKYDLKPGEDQPHVYRFQSSYKKGEGAQSYTAVVLSRFDEPVTLAVPKTKAREGQPDPSAEIEQLVGELKFDEVVEAEVKGNGPVPVLASLDRYTPPQKGKFVKLSEEDVAEGQKGQAVEIDHDGKTVKALVPGKLQSKKWVSDTKVLAAARKLKPDAEVVYRTKQDGDKLYLKEIEPAPKPRGEKATATRDRDGRDANHNMENGDATERRGRRPRNDK